MSIREGFKKKPYKLGLLAQPPLIPTYLWNLGPLNRCQGGIIIEFFIALFHALDYLDQFKAIKGNLLRGVGHLYPLRIPTYLRLSKKPKFVVFFFLEGFPKAYFYIIKINSS